MTLTRSFLLYYTLNFAPWLFLGHFYFSAALLKPMYCKKKLIEHLVRELDAIYQTALTAANRAYSTAPDKANIAENKYDTLALEASYQAEGQAKRAPECGADLKAI